MKSLTRIFALLAVCAALASQALAQTSVLNFNSAVGPFSTTSVPSNSPVFEGDYQYYTGTNFSWDNNFWPNYDGSAKLFVDDHGTLTFQRTDSGAFNFVSFVFASNATNPHIYITASRNGVQDSSPSYSSYTALGGNQWQQVNLDANSFSNITAIRIYFTYQEEGYQTGAPYVSVDNLTMTAVPEPSTYASIFGASALGLVAYRRLRLKRAA